MTLDRIVMKLPSSPLKPPSLRIVQRSWSSASRALVIEHYSRPPHLPSDNYTTQGI